MNRLLSLRLFLAFTAGGLPFSLPAANASATAAGAARTAFLKIIDRPRVPLAPELQLAVERDSLVQLAFSYAAEAGQRVPGLLVKPAGYSRVRRPVVISLHGTGGDKESQLKLLNQFAALGFVAVAIDGRYHGARSRSRKETTDYTDAIHRAYRSGVEHPLFYDTVWDVARLIDWLVTRDDADPTRIGLIGFSKGGIETWLTAAADSRIAAAVSCLGVQSFRWALEHNAWQPRIGTIQTAFTAAAHDAGIAKPTTKFARQFFDRVAPGIAGPFDAPAMLPLIAPRPLLVINGDSDALTPLPGVEASAATARAAYITAGSCEKFFLIIQPKTGHKVSSNSLQAARDWLVLWLRP